MTANSPQRITVKPRSKNLPVSVVVLVSALLAAETAQASPEPTPTPTVSRSASASATSPAPRPSTGHSTPTPPNPQPSTNPPTTAHKSPRPSPTSTAPTGGSTIGPGPSIQLPPPVNPSAIIRAQAARSAADARIAALASSIQSATASLRTLSADATRAQLRYNVQIPVQQQALAAELKARSAQRTANASFTGARLAFVQLVVANYESGSSAGIIGTLLTASDPGQVLDEITVMQQVSNYQATVTENFKTALTARNVTAKAEQAALARVSAATARLTADRSRAESSLAAAQAALGKLRTDLAAAKLTQAQTTAMLSQFLGGWSLVNPAQAAALNTQYQAAAARAASIPEPQNPGHWTAAMGQHAADRALNWIGTPYAWAGGSLSGPTRGVCAGGGAQNDCNVVGFDCSGLTMYGWGTYIALDHFAATQYSVAGKLHPAIGSLLPGDLVFWSGNGTVAGIHHVAMYVGKGNVIQAPESNDIVRITPIGSVSSGLFGATRPVS